MEHTSETYKNILRANRLPLTDRTTKKPLKKQALYDQILQNRIPFNANLLPELPPLYSAVKVKPSDYALPSIIESRPALEVLEGQKLQLN